MKPRAAILAVMACLAAPQPAAAQEGSIEGRVRESWGRGLGIGGARVELVGSTVATVTDYKGRYRLATVSAGPQVIRVIAAGYRSAEQPGIPVYDGTETRQDFFLPSDTMPDAPRVLAPVVDPRARSTRHRLLSSDFSALPVISEAEGVELWSPLNSFRGGRPGAHVTILDGIAVMNGYDRSTSPVGLRVPTELLWEANVDFDPARGGVSSATAGVIDLAMREGGRAWTGGIRYATDRALTGSADLGYDRMSARAEGSLGSARLIGGVEAVGRLQAPASGAPVGEPGAPSPWALSHNAAETVDGAAKVTVPWGAMQTFRLLGVHSRERREVFDPAFKFSTSPGDGRALDATLIGAELRRQTSQVVFTTRISYFARTFTEGALARSPLPKLGALGGSYEFVGADLARAQDTAAARAAMPGYMPPTFSTRTPWGVPAFFLDQGSRGVLRWTRYREVRAGLSVVLAWPRETSLTFDLTGAAAHVSSFVRMLAFLPVGDFVPPATAADSRPLTLAMATTFETRFGAGVFGGGLRVDGVSPGGGAGGMQFSFNPYVKVEAPVGAARIFARAGRSSSFPDLQFLSDLAFDDSAAGGRFRRGGSGLGFESMLWQEVGVAARPWTDGTLTMSLYRRQFSGLVASTTGSVPDSGQFVNRDTSTTVGVDVTTDKALGAGAHLTVSATVANLDLGGPNGFYVPVRTEKWLRSLLVVARGTWRMRTEGSLVLRVQSGQPFTPTSYTQEDAIFTIDALVRRAVTVGAARAWIYVDARNLLDRRAGATRKDADVEAWAQDAYARAPQPIPYDSPRYRANADLDDNGLVEGATELLPLYRAAARDFARPLMSYGTPRTLRLGAAVQF